MFGGINRVQQRFNMAVSTVLALAGFGGFTARRRTMEGQRSIGSGHPIHRKFLRTQNIAKATGRDMGPYPGFCTGHRYAANGSGKLKEAQVNA